MERDRGGAPHIWFREQVEKLRASLFFDCVSVLHGCMNTLDIVVTNTPDCVHGCQNIHRAIYPRPQTALSTRPQRRGRMHVVPEQQKLATWWRHPLFYAICLRQYADTFNARETFPCLVDNFSCGIHDRIWIANVNVLLHSCADILLKSRDSVVVVCQKLLIIAMTIKS